MEQPNLAMIPSGVKATKLYSIMPEDGVGDFTFARASTAYRLNKDGLWESSAANLPRLHYDLTDGKPDSCPCLLLEPASTNILGYSETFSSWGQTRSAITSNSLTSPDGTVNASKMTDDGSTGTNTSQRFLSVTVEEDEDYHFSVFAKKGSMDFIALRTGDFTDGVGIGETFFNLATGAVGTTYANHTASIEKYPNDWYRCSIKFTAGTDTSGTLLIRQASANGTSTVPLDGNSFVYLWGAQFEQDARIGVASSYIKSDSGSQTTRSTETCIDAGDASTFNSEQGILFLEFAQFASGPFGTKFLTISDGSIDNRIAYQLRTDGYRFSIASGGVTQANISLTTNVTDVTKFNKYAVFYREDDVRVYANGIETGTDKTTVIMPSGLNELAFDRGTGSQIAVGRFKDLRYYDTEGMTDTEINNLLTQLTQ